MLLPRTAEEGGEKKKNPLSVCLSLWMLLLLTAADRQSVKARATPRSPAPRLPIDPLPRPFIGQSLNISGRPSVRFPPAGLNCLSPFTSSEHLPPPPSALVATETADSGRVGGCLRALAAVPHAALSQYISASALLLWP